MKCVSSGHAGICIFQAFKDKIKNDEKNISTFSSANRNNNSSNPIDLCKEKRKELCKVKMRPDYFNRRMELRNE